MNFWLAANKKKIRYYLKLLGFLTGWITVPVILLGAVLGSYQKTQTPQVYQSEIQPQAANEVTVVFKVLLKGVSASNAAAAAKPVASPSNGAASPSNGAASPSNGAADQPVYLQARLPAPSAQADGGQAVDLQSNQSFTFDPVMAAQDKSDPEIFTARLNLNPSLIGKNYTFWIKGPLRLQRRFDNVALAANQVLDFTAKPLLPGDLKLPDTGEDNQVDEIDRDYLWSLTAAQRPLTPAEIKAADLDLDGKITSRDYSLLIDNLGQNGEK